VKNITLLQIESFLTVARHLNCSKAARFLHVTQPSLSKTIKTFETAVGKKLFVRSGHGMALTAAGEYLYHALGSIQKDLDKALDYVAAIDSDAVRKLRVVLPMFYDSDENFEPVKRLFKTFSEKNRDIAVETSLCDFIEQRQALELGMADLAVTMDFLMHSMDRVSVKRVLKMKRYIVVSANHPLAARKTLDFSALENEVFFRVESQGDDYLKEILINECEHYGFKPKRIEFLPNLMTFLHNVKEQKGLGICGRLRNYEDGYGIKFFPLPEIEDGQYVVAAWRADSVTKEAKAFLDLI